MSRDTNMQPCDPVAPIGARRSDSPAWEPGIARLRVSGIQCRHCATRIKNALARHPQVLGADIDMASGVIEVLFDFAELSLDRVAEIIVGAADGCG